MYLINQLHSGGFDNLNIVGNVVGCLIVINFIICGTSTVVIPRL